MRQEDAAELNDLEVIDKFIELINSDGDEDEVLAAVEAFIRSLPEDQKDICSPDLFRTKPRKNPQLPVK
jgi:hypothetical protein